MTDDEPKATVASSSPSATVEGAGILDWFMGLVLENVNCVLLFFTSVYVFT